MKHNINLRVVCTMFKTTITKLSHHIKYILLILGLSVGIANAQSSIATGGTVSTITVGGIKYFVHIFTANGTFTTTATISGLEYLVVGGGGGGTTLLSSKYYGNGGGGGDVKTGTLSNVAASTISVTVGAGGAGNHLASGDAGGQSIFSSITAAGGGGGVFDATQAGKGGTSGNGNLGADSDFGNTTGGGFHGGGGGGAGGIASTFNGGAGVSSSITGSPVFYGGGGSARRDVPTTFGDTTSGQTASNMAGADNSGAGGGGSYNIATYAGGSGIVIVRYPASTATTLGTPTGDAQSAAAGTAVANPLTVTVTDAENNPVVGHSVTFAVTAGGGSLGTTTATTDASGVATSTWTLGTTAGATQTVTATASGLTGSPVTFNATATGAAANLALTSGDTQTGAAGVQLANPITVTVTDANNNPVAGTTVTFAVTAGGGSLGTTTATTDASGVATSTWTLGATAGATQTATATASGLTGSPVTFNATATAGAAANLVFTAEPVGGLDGQALSTQPVVAIQDAFGNVITTDSSTVVTLAISSGAGGTLGGTLTAIASNGVATFTNVTLTGVGGTIYKIDATASGLTSATSGDVTVQTGVSPVELGQDVAEAMTLRSQAILSTAPDIGDLFNNIGPDNGFAVNSLDTGTAGYLNFAQTRINMQSSASGHTLRFSSKSSPEARLGNGIELWTQGKWVRTLSTGAKSDTFSGYFGGHKYLNKDTFVGLLGEVDITDSEADNSLGGKNIITSKGYLIGPYFASRNLGPTNISVEGLAAFGRSSNDVETSTGATGSFSSNRTFYKLKFNNKFKRGAYDLYPSIETTYFRDVSDAFTDSSGAAVAAQTSSSNDIALGLTAKRGIHLGNKSTSMLSMGAKLRYAATVSGTSVINQGDYVGRLDLGTSTSYGNNGRMYVDIFYDGLLKQGYESFGLSLKYSRQF